MKILITSIGRRVQLIKYLKKSCTVVGADAGNTAPAINFVDKFYKVPRIADEDYVSSLAGICYKEKVDMLIPLHEYEFYILCKNREKFKEVGTRLILSSKSVIDVCQDKLNTCKFFIKNNIDTPLTYSKQEILSILSHKKDIKFPLIIKPVNGMGSASVYKLNNSKELKFFVDYVENPIVQEYVEGIEYTIDVLCDLNGIPISIVPRERLEVRDGEVSKSRTVLHKGIIKETYRLMECLSNLKKDEDISVVGPYTIQCRIDKNDNIKFIEINPRFGGGVPLTFEAGVDYGKYFNMMVKGEEISPIIGRFKEIAMLRYDDAVFTTRKEI